MVLPRFPYPPDKGDKLRAYQQIQCFKQLGHQVFLFCLSDKKIDPGALTHIRSLVDKLFWVRLNKIDIVWSLLKAIPSKLPFQSAYHTKKSALKSLEKFVESVLPDVLYFQLIRTMKYAQSPWSQIALLDMMDPFARNIELRIPYTPAWLKIFLKEEEARMDYYERLAFERFRRVAIISERDREEIRSSARMEAFILPNSVDLEFYKPMPTKKIWDVCFVGSMRYHSNVESSVFLAEKVMPFVWEQLPESRLVIVGADPPRRVRRLKDPLVEVTGRVHDTRPYYAASKVMCAPMFLNTGVQNKILEAMAMGIPVVTTPRANESIRARDGVEALLAETPEELASHIIRILTNQIQYELIKQQAYEFVSKQFSAPVVCQSLKNFIEGIS